MEFKQVTELRHSPDAGNNAKREEDDVHQCEVLEQHVHVVVHDAAPGVHKTGENADVQVALAAQLLIVNDDFIEKVELSFRKAKLRCRRGNPLQNRRIRINRVNSKHELLAQVKHPEQLAIVNSLRESLLHISRGLLDHPKPPDELNHRCLHAPQHELVEGLWPCVFGVAGQGRFISLYDRQVIALQDQADGAHRVMTAEFGRCPLPYDDVRIAVELRPGDFIRVQHGFQGVPFDGERGEDRLLLLGGWVRVDHDIATPRLRGQ